MDSQLIPDALLETVELQPGHEESPQKVVKPREDTKRNYEVKPNVNEGGDGNGIYRFKIHCTNNGNFIVHKDDKKIPDKSYDGLGNNTQKPKIATTCTTQASSTSLAPSPDSTEVAATVLAFLPLI